MLAIARQRATDLGREVTLQEGDAVHLPFDDASFDTVTCALALCTIPSPVAAVGEMRRVLAPGGRLLLLDHIGSTWLPLYAAQWLAERITVRTAGEHFTRRQLPLVKAAGFQVEETERGQSRHRRAHPRRQARLNRQHRRAANSAPQSRCPAQRFKDRDDGLTSTAVAGRDARLMPHGCDDQRSRSG
jgi:SAM-dependent methyltransferase